MLNLIDVSKRYHEGQPNEVSALREVSLRIGAGVTALRGPSGSGKSTLLALIGCLATPTTGRILLDGEPLSGLPEIFLADVRRRVFGFAFQRAHLINGLSALENVMLPAYPTGAPHRALRERAVALLEELRVGHRADERVERLSGGEMQRVAIARALINGPRILLADEPTANLDGALTAQFLEIMSELKARGLSAIIASHDARVCDSPLVDRIVVLNDGRLARAA